MGFCARTDCIAPVYSNGLCRQHARERAGVKRPREVVESPRERVYVAVKEVYEAEGHEDFERAFRRLKAAARAWTSGRRR